MNTSQISDRTITRQVQNRLSGRGLAAPCRIAVATQNGEVTLSGSVQAGHQKGTAVQLTKVISGVRRVVDRLVLNAPKKW